MQIFSQLGEVATNHHLYRCFQMAILPMHDSTGTVSRSDLEDKMVALWILTGSLCHEQILDLKTKIWNMFEIRMGKLNYTNAKGLYKSYGWVNQSA